jgi:gamma-glutamyl hercynylcysteine S-oxide synthase
MMLAATGTLDRAAALDRFQRIRARTCAMFDLLDPSAYFERPIPLRNPVVFYEGHLPAFAVNTLIKKALGRPGIDARLEQIFARGIDPETEATAIARGNPAWPSRDVVREYAAAADRLIADAITSADLETSHPMLERAQALWAILEHEEMHQETLAYMWHEVPYDRKRKPADYQTLLTVPVSSGVPTSESRHSAAIDARQVSIPGGMATLGTPGSTFAWDNEGPAQHVSVAAFAMDVHNVTNAQFMGFVDAGGYEDARWWTPEDWAWIVASGVTHPHFWQREDGHWYWRAMFERVPLPLSWPVYVTWAEANAFARWRGMRLPTEAEFHRAAYGEGDAGQYDHPSGNYDFVRWDPEPVGSRPNGVSAPGVYDLVGNGWEWTSSVFAPYDGFAPLPSYPEYSADFFDGTHYVMKGASPVTAASLVRPGFRNWFRPRYPYVYSSFRCVAPA